jgi:hypothetical protein
MSTIIIAVLFLLSFADFSKQSETACFEAMKPCHAYLQDTPTAVYCSEEVKKVKDCHDEIYASEVCKDANVPFLRRASDKLVSDEYKLCADHGFKVSQ